MKPDREVNILRETELRLGGIQLLTLLTSQTSEGETVQRRRRTGGTLGDI